MSVKYKFAAQLKEGIRGGAYVEVPVNVMKHFDKKRIKIVAEIEGIEYRGSIVPMNGCQMLGILKNIRESTNKNIGDTINIEFYEDTQERTVEIPEDLQKALDDNAIAAKTFEKLSYTHKKEYVKAILDAKKEETRTNRIAKTIEILKNKH